MPVETATAEAAHPASLDLKAAPPPEPPPYTSPLSASGQPDLPASDLDRPAADHKQSLQQGTSPAPQTHNPQNRPAPPLASSSENKGWTPYRVSTPSSTTPGADNFSEPAGGLAGIAYGVAAANARESGVAAVRGLPPNFDGKMDSKPHPQDFLSPSSAASIASSTKDRPPYITPAHSQLSLMPGNPAMRTSNSPTPVSSHEEYYSYQRRSRNLESEMSDFDPNNIEDDGDDGLDYTPQRRRSVLALDQTADSKASDNASGGGKRSTLGAMMGRKSVYGPVQSTNVNAAERGQSTFDLATEKTRKLAQRKSRNKKLKWLFTSILVLVVVAAVAAGVGVGVRNN